MHQHAIWHDKITDGLAEGYVVLKIPCGIQPLYESGRGERIVKKGREEPDVIEERIDGEQKELPCPLHSNETKPYK